MLSVLEQTVKISVIEVACNSLSRGHQALRRLSPLYLERSLGEHSVLVVLLVESSRNSSEFTFLAGTLETQEAPFVLWDSAAGSSVYSDYKCGELGYILDGNLPNRFDLSQAISPQSQHFITSSDQADRVHCMCFVVPCDFAASCDRGYLVRVREMKEYAMDHGELHFWLQPHNSCWTQLKHTHQRTCCLNPHKAIVSAII